MKNLAGLVLALALSCLPAFASPTHLKLTPVVVIPDTATAQYARYSQRLTANGQLHVTQLASELANGSLNPSQIEGMVQPGCSSDLGGCNGGADIEALAFIVMMQAAKSAQDDLKSIMQGVKEVNEGKAKLRAMETRPNAMSAITAQQLNADAVAINGKLDSMSELSEEEQLRLQMAMDRRSKMMDALSNILKKLSDTSNAIIQNLK